MANDMLTPEQLSTYPGAPFEQAEVDNAVATLRDAVKWHIAPSRDDTKAFDVPRGSSRIWLPTGKDGLTAVAEIRNANGDAYDAGTYKASKELGIIYRLRGFWPHGIETVEVDFTHGFESCPADLLTVVAAIAATSRRDQNVREGATAPYLAKLFGMDKIIDRYGVWQNQGGWA